MLKKIFLILLLLFINIQIIYAQPLNPSLPGYENVKKPDRPVIKIISPELDSIILGPKVTLDYVISGITLVATEEARSTILQKPIQNIKGEGHLKITFAKEKYPVPKPKSTNNKSPLIFTDIPEGSYRITIEIVKNNGASFAPKIADTTKFTVVHPLSPTPTLILTTTPIFREKAIANKQDLLIGIGVVFIVAPFVYLILHL